MYANVNSALRAVDRYRICIHSQALVRQAVTGLLSQKRLQEWREIGHDEDSLVNDPMFSAPQNDDY
jgi:hypothetical protein